MGHVTKPVTQRSCWCPKHVDGRCLWSRLGIEGVWKLSIKGSRVPWTGVDKWSGCPGTVHGPYKVLLYDLRWVSLGLCFPKASCCFGEGRIRASRDGWDVRCYQVHGWRVVSQELKSGPRVSTQGWAASLSLLRHRPLWVMPLTSQCPAGHSIMTSCAQWTPEQGRKGGQSGEGGDGAIP